MADTQLILYHAGRAFASTGDVELDLAYGDDENSFDLILPSSMKMSAGDRWVVDGTPWGGIVDTITTESTDGSTTVTYSGRSLQGVLVGKILAPDSGEDYLTVSGQLADVMSALVSRIGLQSLFRVELGVAGTIGDYRFERYVDAYAGLSSMLKTMGKRLTLTCDGDMVSLGASDIREWDGTVDSELMDFTASREYRRTNHLIGVGEGELKNRAVSEWFADEDGNVSRTQTQFGVDEVTEIYDYTNADVDELSDRTKEKLEDIQAGQGTIDISIRDGDTPQVGDTVTAYDVVTGLSVKSTVTKHIVKISDGVLTVDVEVGQDSSIITMQGTGEQQIIDVNSIIQIASRT